MTPTAVEPDHVVVLAGGLGTRIRDALADTPKALADIAGTPFIDRKLDEFRRNGIGSATFLLGHGSDVITSHISAQRFGMEISIIEDGPTLLGTGGALLNALPELPADFLLTYGDSLLDFDYSLLHQARVRANTDCALAVTSSTGEADFLNSRLDGGLIVRHSKDDCSGMNATDYGVMLFTRSAVKRAAATLPTIVDLSIILANMAEAGDLAGVPTHADYWEIGTPRTLSRVRHHFSGVSENDAAHGKQHILGKKIGLKPRRRTS